LFYPATRYVEALSLRAQITQQWIAACIGSADLALLPAISIPVPTIAATTEGDPADVARVIGQLTHCHSGVAATECPLRKGAPRQCRDENIMSKSHRERAVLGVMIQGHGAIKLGGAVGQVAGEHKGNSHQKRCPIITGVLACRRSARAWN
jgi:hypothetical protein